MAQCQRAVNVLNNDFGAFYSHHHTVVVGFEESSGSREEHGVSHGRESMARARSLLSDLLLRRDASVHFSCAVSDMDQEEEEETCSMDGSMDWEGSLDPWQGLTHPPDQRGRSGDSDGSSSVSQPIPIPAVCYFKDEMQRAALDKLNQKRKWYQQQLEAERMMSKSIAKSKQVAAASKGNKPTGRPGAPA